eukprot:9003741-Heterocapsa_arctica.AAC.1
MEIDGMKRFDIKHNVIEFPELSLKDIAEITDMPKDAVEQFNLIEAAEDEKFIENRKLAQPMEDEITDLPKDAVEQFNLLGAAEDE